MKEPNEIDSLFQSAFDGLRLTPDPTVKENIDLAIASKKKRRRFLFILFPLLFGAVGFAATLYFNPFSEGNLNRKNKHSEINRIHSNSVGQLAKTVSNSGNNPRKKLIRKNAILRPVTEGKSEEITSGTYNKSAKKRSLKAGRKNAILRPNQKTNSQLPDLPTGKSDLSIKATPEPGKTELKSANKIPEKPENNILQEQDTTNLTETEPDSNVLPKTKISDSLTALPAESFKCIASKRRADNWSLSLLTYWEGEKKRAADLQSEPFINNKRETAVIHSSTFYGKIEVNRKFTPRWEALTGISFRSSNIIQYGYVDSIKLPTEGVGSVNPLPITNAPDTINSREVQSFRVNSVVLPLGFAYSFPLTQKMRIRLAGGAEFTYGQFSRKALNTALSAPTLRPFGCSVWVRPEFYYSFGRTELFGFGTFNQTLSQQLKWDFEPRRNPAFGGGIGLRIQL